MSDISLTASMRSNLLSLQNTSKLMDRTQERLSDGKKVNSAMDNPSSYYTARSLNNRAGDLNALLDSMGQGISTIKAANEGIESITSFVEQAKAVANSARNVANASAESSGTWTATPADKTYKFTLDGTDYSVDSKKTGSGLAADIQAYLRSNPGPNLAAATATYDNTTGTITIDKLGDESKTTTLADAYSFKIEIVGKSDPVYVDTTSSTSLATMATAINTALTGLIDDAGNAIEGLSAAVVDDNILVKSDHAVELSIKGDASGVKLSGTAGNQSRVDYMSQYNELIRQITDMAKDSGYKGVNLLQEDDLTVVFNEDRGSYLDIKGVDASSEGLGLTTVSGWGDESEIIKSIDAIDNAISKLRTYASEFGNNYSILQTREDFTANLISVLEEGADKLTLADMNEESANMLALQTRQQLAINSLSLASQAAQSVLKLFS